MARLTIRPATLEDIDNLKIILNDAIRYKIAKHDVAWGNRGWSIDEVVEVINFGHTNIVFLDENIVGCVDVIWDDEYNWGQILGLDKKAGYLHRLAVLSDYKGKGLGSEIINWVAECIKGRDRVFIRLDCRKANLSLCSYYEGLGFKRIYPDEKLESASAYYQRLV
jgi:ribosomal protein S18 acetylase RimI-like enzyme